MRPGGYRKNGTDSRHFKSLSNRPAIERNNSNAVRWRKRIRRFRIRERDRSTIRRNSRREGHVVRDLNRRATGNRNFRKRWLKSVERGVNHPATIRRKSGKHI